MSRTNLFGYCTFIGLIALMVGQMLDDVGKETCSSLSWWGVISFVLLMGMAFTLGMAAGKDQ